ncbi:MAG: HPF/RaiA family ribosome-associated protein [Ramlibacter sp.]|nr:HPF/RaiA family ribosome-associated protein [Ramlibacter sp.]
MQVQVNAGNGIENKESLERWAVQHLDEALVHFRQDITRVELQLSDENGAAKGAADLRCTLEARLANHQPVAATHHAANQDLAIRGATDKLRHLLGHTLGKIAHKRDRESIRTGNALAPE